MPHIDLPGNMAGIVSLFQFRPETSKPLNELAEILLHKPASLEVWERELIGAYVSYLSECKFCYNTHSAMVRYHKSGEDIMEAVKEDVDTAPISDKMKSLLKIAGTVQADARKVSSAQIDEARGHGANDNDIHDTVLIAATFCMYNKYVDGLATAEWGSQEVYDERAKLTAEGGYFHEDY